jgi:outer membrane receptor for ferrienterochelin and colicins
MQLPIKRWWLYGYVGVMGAGTLAAHAQSIDYGALEQLFGEPVTTSVTGSPQRASQVPAAIEIITAEDIRRSGARDIPGVLRHVLGINVLQWGNDNADIAIRGYNQALSPRLQVLIDGREVHLHSLDYAAWSSLPVELDGIRQIEVVKGPNTALFGFNAVGGVINIITYHPVYDAVNQVSVTGGTQSLVQGSLVGGVKLGSAAGVRVQAGGYHNDDFSTPQPPQDQGSRLGNIREAVNLRGAFALNNTTQLAVEATDSRVRQPDVVLTAVTVSENIHTNSIEAVLTSDSALGLTEARAYRNGTDIVAAQPGPALDFNDTTQVAHVQQLFKIGSDNTFRLATEYQHDRIGVTPVGGAELSSQGLAASAMWEVKLQPTVTVNDAVRVDNIAYSRSGYLPPVLGLTDAEWDRHFTEWSFNSGLVWSLSELDRLRFTIARGVQMPSLAAFGAVLLPLPYPGLYDGGNPLLQPTIDLHYEIGWSRSLPALGAQFAVSAYHDDIRGAPAQFGNQVTVSPHLVGGPINLGDTRSYGLELSLKGHAGDHWRWGLGYAPETITDDFAGHPVQVTLVDFEDTTPKHTADAQLGWSGGAWELDAFLQYESADYGVRGLNQNIPGAVLVRIPAYLTADARLAYRLTTRATLALSGQNLLHDQQVQTAVSAVERRVLATASYRY